MEKDILLIDGNSMLFRAYHATAYQGRRMSTSSGIPTNAIFGFANMINKAIALLEPEYVLVAWDTDKPTFRHNKYDGYKGTRKPVDEELVVQFPIAREFLDAMGMYRYEEAGIEADDIIGTTAKRFPNNKVHILSSDKDLLQLIDDTTDVLLMKKGITEMQLTNADKLKEMMNLTPTQIIDFKGLSGDASDNIPGVKGVGEKTAVKLLNDYGTVEGVYEHIDEIKGKLKEKLINDQEKAFMSKDLATIKTDCDLPFTLEDLRFEKDMNHTNKFFHKYEMMSLIQNEEVKKEEIVEELTIIESLDKDLIEDNMCLLLDYDNEPYYNSTLFGIVLKNSKGIYYMDKEHMLMDSNLQEYLNSDIPKFTYDVKTVYHLLNRYGFDYKEFSFDLMIASFLCDNSITSLDKFLMEYEITLDKNRNDIYGKSGKPIFIDEDIKFAYLKNLIYKLYPLQKKLKKEIVNKGLEYIMYEMEMPLAHILFEMEKEGITTSKEVLDDIGYKTLTVINECETQIYELVGHTFNVNSPKQLAEVLFDELGLKANRKRSTAIDVLEKLENSHPVIPLLIKQRKYQKIYSTYTEGLKKHILEDGKIHTIFNQCLTQTGRLSSSEPNMQNISVRDNEAKQVRKAFLPSAGHILYTADYSQVELRMLAHMANETKMIEAFNDGFDIHTHTAMQVYGVSADAVDKNMRRQAKVVNFGMVYGQSEFGLATELNISRSEASAFMDKYFTSYPEIHAFMDQTIKDCESNGYVTTLFGRRRYINEIHDKNYMKREFGKRAAMNAPIQGSAADLIKIAMIKVSKALKENNMQSKMILQVHDELVFDVVLEEKDKIEKIVKDAMEHAVELKVPLVADGGFGENYYDVK